VYPFEIHNPVRCSRASQPKLGTLTRVPYIYLQALAKQSISEEGGKFRPAIAKWFSYMHSHEHYVFFASVCSNRFNMLKTYDTISYASLYNLFSRAMTEVQQQADGSVNIFRRAIADVQEQGSDAGFFVRKSEGKHIENKSDENSEDHTEAPDTIQKAFHLKLRATL